MWGELKNRRRFFEEYAREERFDPLVSSNWYSQPRDFIMSFKVRGSESEEEVSLGEVREEVKKIPKKRRNNISTGGGTSDVVSQVQGVQCIACLLSRHWIRHFKTSMAYPPLSTFLFFFIFFCYMVLCTMILSCIYFINVLLL